MLETPRDDNVSWTRYRAQEALVPIGDDYVVEDVHGRTVFQVDGKLLRLRESLNVRGADGQEIYQIRGTVLDVKDVLNIARDGQLVATVRRTREQGEPRRYVVELPGGDDVQVDGDVAESTYTLTSAGQVIARVTRPFLPRFRHPIDIEIGQSLDHHLVLAVVICLRVMTCP